MHAHPVRTALLLLAIAGLLAPACASTGTGGGGGEPGLVFLGKRQVSFGVDRDVISVGAKSGRFSALRLKVQESPLEMYDIVVTFGNGEKWSPPTRLNFGKGSWTRRIDLPGSKRVVRKVAFLYSSKRPRSGKAQVGLFGIP